LISATRTATLRFVSTHPGISMHVGIGSPYQGLKGLRNSLAEAREASILAQAGGGDAVVQHTDELGMRRILFGWYASETFNVFAKTLLEPLQRADPDGDLIATLECFLDSKSSPKLTATTMNLHRNTILNRMDRIRSLLSVDLERPDERLAVQLACRVQRLHVPAT
jgi:purine catabolism regulator